MIKYLFVDECKEITSKSEKISFVAAKWKTRSEEERKECQDKAKTFQQINPDMLTAAKSKKLIANIKRILVRKYKMLTSFLPMPLRQLFVAYLA